MQLHEFNPFNNPTIVFPFSLFGTAFEIWHEEVQWNETSSICVLKQKILQFTDRKSRSKLSRIMKFWKPLSTEIKLGTETNLFVWDRRQWCASSWLSDRHFFNPFFRRRDYHNRKISRMDQIWYVDNKIKNTQRASIDKNLKKFRKW